MPDGSLTPLLSFALVVAMIPVALWLLKRTPLGGSGQGQALKSVAVLPLSASQRIVTVEVGTGSERRWLVLGVTPSSIQTLHCMLPPDAQAPGGPAATPTPTPSSTGATLATLPVRSDPS
ncbi:MAG: FliO/MopB family protein [Rubrivivax sp.]|jgi:flagellar protein FliO/FliZ|nr:flagellar biosynthetic protein FliO [Rubrivivax sp.]